MNEAVCWSTEVRSGVGVGSWEDCPPQRGSEGLCKSMYFGAFVTTKMKNFSKCQRKKVTSRPIIGALPPIKLLGGTYPLSIGL